MKPTLNLLKRLVEFGGWLAAFLLLATTVLISSEIFLRTFFGRSTQVAEEYSGYFLAAIVYMGAAYTLQKGEHIRVEIIRERLGKVAGLWLERIVLLIGLGFSVLLAYTFFDQFMSSVQYDSRSFMPSRTRLAIPHGAITIGAVLLCIQFFVLFIETFLKDAQPQVTVQSH